MYRVKSGGPNYDPCGILVSAIWGLDLKPSVKTVGTLQERYDFN